MYGDLSMIYFQNFAILRHVPFALRKIPHSVDSLYNQVVPLLFVAGAMLVIIVVLRAKLPISGLRRILPFAATGVLTVPLSITGYIVQGGTENALSPTLYFCALTFVAVSYLLMFEDAAQRSLRPYIIGLLILLCSIEIPILARNFDPFSVKMIFKASSSEVCYKYDRARPGQVYFPFNQVSVFFAEHRFYDSDWGVGDLVGAGVPITIDQIRGQIPQTARYIAYPPDAYGDWLLPFLAAHRRPHMIPELPSFQVFEIER
jgi:hypothetical protein